MFFVESYHSPKISIHASALSPNVLLEEGQPALPGISGGSCIAAAMQQVLDVYEQPYDPKRPKVCFDESRKQLIEQTLLPAQPGQVRRVDDEYQRNGTRNLFMFFEPLANWRHVEVTEHRTAQDFAHPFLTKQP